MIEIALGVLVVATTLALVMGAGDMAGLPVRELLPLLGMGGAAALAGSGLLLVLHGGYRLLRKRRKGDQHWLRTTGLMCVTLLLVFVFGLGIPLLAEPLAVIRIDGLPLGFYMAAQGCLIALVVLAFVFARKQDAIDVEEAGTEGQTRSFFAQS